MFLAGEGLQPIATATTVRVGDGERLVTDGPFAETKEQLGGFYLLECKTSTRRSSGRRRSRCRAGAIEVRPVMDYEAVGRRGASRRGGELAATSVVVDRLFRRESGRAVATLIRVLGDFDLAEEAVQEAFVVALERWPRDGVPDNPAAWIITRRAQPGDRPAPRASACCEAKRARARGARAAAADARRTDAGARSPDDRLRLIFTCCHPALAPEAQVALTLRTLGGLTTAEIARAFLVAEPTMAQRLVRAKRKIRDAGIPLRGAARTRTAGAARLGAGDALPDLQRGLRGDGRRRARPARAVRRGDPAGARAASS